MMTGNPRKLASLSILLIEIESRLLPTARSIGEAAGYALIEWANLADRSSSHSFVKTHRGFVAEGARECIQVDSANVNMSAGRDLLSVGNNTKILAGTVDGGGHSNDKLDIRYKNRTDTLRFKTTFRSR